MFLFDLVLYSTFSQILLDEKLTDKVKEIRYRGLQELSHILNYYKGRGFDDKLLMPIAEKKCSMIMNCNSKTEMEKIVKPRCPHYDGSKFIPDNYNVLEEELISWSETSLRGPLNDIGFKRYLEVFMLVFPEEYKKIIERGKE